MDDKINVFQKIVEELVETDQFDATLIDEDTDEDEDVNTEDKEDEEEFPVLTAVNIDDEIEKVANAITEEEVVVNDKKVQLVIYVTTDIQLEV